VILPALTLSFGPVGRLAHNGPGGAVSVLDETRAEVLLGQYARASTIASDPPQRSASLARRLPRLTQPSGRCVVP
jgi:hypothetical protein